MENLPKSRKEALEIGSSYYYTGKPCVHGHYSKKSTRDWTCYECHRIYQRKYSRHRFKKRAGRFTDWKKTIPVWEDEYEISQWFNNIPEGYHLDHIVPIKNPLVCGLNCRENYEYVEAGWNRFKKNTFWPDMPEYDYDFMKWLYKNDYSNQ